jgi:hypothetical protein
LPPFKSNIPAVCQNNSRALADTDVFSKSDPVCVLDEWRPALRGGLPGQQMQWVEVGRTEVIDNNLNPEWSRKFQLDYFFERVQRLRFRVYDFFLSIFGRKSLPA